MARKKKAWFDNSALIEYGEKLDEMGGDVLKNAVTESMQQSKAAINTEIEKVIAKPNLPAAGKYSTGDTLRSLDKNINVEWDGNVAALPLGFDFSKPGGLTSALLMHGTPNYGPVPGLYETVKGSRAQSIARKETKKTLQKHLKG